jgi:DNA polymerase-3 subunit epsilon
MTTLLPCYVLLDLETTGATPTQDRITEIGLIRYENGIEVGRWNTLINPEVSISPFIQRLTGITQGMVDHAPTFAQVCETLLQWLDQAVLCAHNVRFDYGFLKTNSSASVLLSRRNSCARSNSPENSIRSIIHIASTPLLSGFS